MIEEGRLKQEMKQRIGDDPSKPVKRVYDEVVIDAPTNNICGLSDQWAVRPMGCWTNGLLDQWAVGPMGCWTNGLSPQEHLCFRVAAEISEGIGSSRTQTDHIVQGSVEQYA